MRCGFAGCLLVAALLSIGVTASAQTPQPTFDVAAVRPAGPSPDGRNHIWSDYQDSRFRAQNQPLDGLLQFAFDLPASRILGGPDSLRHAPFDIDAKSDVASDAIQKALDPEPAKQRKREMLQALLRERFNLVAHMETRDLPIYELVIAKGGPHLTPSKAGRYYNSGRNSLTGTGYTTTVLAQDLARYAGRVVIDKTGLDGQYDIDLHWSSGDSADEGPSLFTALQEKLGMKLQPAHGSVQVLVIDQLSPPAEN